MTSPVWSSRKSISGGCGAFPVFSGCAASACLHPYYLLKDAVVRVKFVFLCLSPELFLSLCHRIDFCLEDRLFGSLAHYSAITHLDGRGWSEEDDSFVFISKDNRSALVAVQNHVLSSGTLVC